MDIVYVETTVVGNIAGRIHPDPGVASRQRITREWWNTATVRYRIVTSQLTVDECGDGDPSAATERLEVLKEIPLLDQSGDAEALAELLIDRKAVPASQPRDALHIATAAAKSALQNNSRRPKMIPDPNEEILVIKRRLAAKFDNDVHRIAADVRKRQDHSGHEVVSLPPRRCTPSTTNNAVNRSGESDGN